MKYKFLVIDSYAYASEHGLVNESFIEYFDTQNSLFLLNDNHISFVNFSKKENYPILDSKINKRGLRLLNRELLKTLTAIFCIIKNSKLCDNFVILGASKFQFFMYGLLSFFFKGRFKIIMHSQTESLINKDRKSLFDKLFNLGFGFLSKNSTKFLFLSKHIKDYIYNDKLFYFIKHPIPKSKIKSIKMEKNDNIKPNLATVGLLRKDTKNSHLISSIKSNKVDLFAIGRILNDDFDFSPHINKKIWPSVYSQDDFTKAISNIDAFLYFFDKEQYRGTASGTVIDAILYGKYVLYLENNAISSLLNDYMFKKSFNSISEMNEYLGCINNNDLQIDPNCDNRSSYVLFSEDNADNKELIKWIS